MSNYEINPEFISNSVASEFLLEWIASKGVIRKGHAEKLEAAFKALPSEYVTEFADLVGQIYVAFNEEKALARVRNLRDNSAEAKAARVAAYTSANSEATIAKTITESGKEREKFVKRVHLAG